MDRLVGASVYIDTNIFILFSEGVAAARAPVVELFRGARSGSWQIVTSDFTLAEVLVGPLRAGRSELLGYCENLLSPRLGLVRQPVDVDILLASARLSASLGVKLPDAIHLATAGRCGCAFLISEDQRLRVAGSIELLRLTDLSNEAPPSETP